MIAQIIVIIIVVIVDDGDGGECCMHTTRIRIEISHFIYESTSYFIPLLDVQWTVYSVYVVLFTVCINSYSRHSFA